MNACAKHQGPTLMKGDRKAVTERGEKAGILSSREKQEERKKIEGGNPKPEMSRYK